MLTFQITKGTAEKAQTDIRRVGNRSELNGNWHIFVFVSINVRYMTVKFREISYSVVGFRGGSLDPINLKSAKKFSSEDFSLD
jgi:hypothetical protein